MRERAFWRMDNMLLYIESYRLQNWSIATNGLRSYGNGSPTDIDIENILEHQKYLHELSYGNNIAIKCLYDAEFI